MRRFIDRFLITGLVAALGVPVGLLVMTSAVALFNPKPVHAQQNVINIVPNVAVYSLGSESGQITTVGAATSRVFAGIANTRHYITQATCTNVSATALSLTIYDDGAGQNASNSGTYKMYTIPCTTSTTTGAVPAPPFPFNPPLETSIGNAVDVGVGTAANSVTISLNGFKGRR